MRSIIMNKVSVFCLLVSLFAFGSCHEDEETEFENKVYTNFQMSLMCLLKVVNFDKANIQQRLFPYPLRDFNSVCG